MRRRKVRGQREGYERGYRTERGIGERLQDKERDKMRESEKQK